MTILIKTFLIILILQISLQARQINIDNLVNSAKKQQKHLIVWFHKTDCGYCESMKEFTFNNDIIKDYMTKYFLFEHINVYDIDSITYGDFRGNGREFAQEVGYDFYPTTLFFDDDANEAYVEIGYIDNKRMSNEKRFYKILNFVNTKSYKKIEFEDYKFKQSEEF